MIVSIHFLFVFYYLSDTCILDPLTEGQLRIIDQVTKAAGDSPFEFEVDRDNNDYNQRRYEALGEVYNNQTNFIYEIKTIWQ
jgi:hypothetical protein